MRKRLLVGTVLLLSGASYAQAQAPTEQPDECFGFTFGKWDPPLKRASSTYSPGYDPTMSQPAGAPRSWATRAPTTSSPGAPADSVLLLFPPWWPAGVAIEWTGQHGDTLIGTARALVADGRVKNPETSVRALHVPCRPASDRGRASRDTSSAS
jgi:hypothetical protein